MHLIFIYLTEKGNNSANIYIIQSDFGLCKKQKDIIVDCYSWHWFHFWHFVYRFHYW